MDFYKDLHEQYFLNTIKKIVKFKTVEVQTDQDKNNDINKRMSENVSDKIDSVFLSGVFWVLSGLLIINKNRNNLDSILTKEVTDKIYKLVMKCLGKKRIKKKLFLNLKKEKLFFTSKDIKKLTKNMKTNVEHLEEKDKSNNKDKDEEKNENKNEEKNENKNEDKYNIEINKRIHKEMKEMDIQKEELKKTEKKKK